MITLTTNVVKGFAGVVEISAMVIDAILDLVVENHVVVGGDTI